MFTSVSIPQERDIRNMHRSVGDFLYAAMGMLKEEE